MNDSPATHSSALAADANEDPPLPTPREGAALEVIDSAGLLDHKARKWLFNNGLGAISTAADAGGEVRVRLVADAEMAALHLRHSGIPGTTDVLTFDLRDLAPGEDPALAPLDVDIVACVDEAARRAAEREHAVERELLLYLLHGVLHCLGYDDHDEAGHARMHAREDEILESIGVGATFGRGEGGA